MVALLSAEGLQRQFGGVTAVDGVDLAVGRGEMRCIIGPNGAGKSTLFNMLGGTVRPTAGRIRFEGRDVVGLPLHAFARIGIARKFQVPSVFETMTVRDNLVVAAPRGGGAAVESRLERLLDLLSLSAAADVLAGVLAHGQKQWLEIGMVLMTEAKLLLLDEPTAGMSAEETQRTAELLLGLRGEVTVLAIEHDMRFVRALDCPTLVMHQGRVIAEGPFAAVERNEMVRDVYLGRR